MNFNECLCYTKRNNKNNNLKKKIDKTNKIYTDMINDISSPKLLPNGTYMMIECSNLLCTKIAKKPLEKQAICKNKIHYFCSAECWSEWLENPNIYNVSPMTQYNSPEYIKYFREDSNLNEIPPLFI